MMNIEGGVVVGDSAVEPRPAPFCQVSTFATRILYLPSVVRGHWPRVPQLVRQRLPALSPRESFDLEA